MKSISAATQYVTVIYNFMEKDVIYELNTGKKNNTPDNKHELRVND